MIPALLAIATPWSTLIIGGTIVDGTGSPAYSANLRIQGDRIIEISSNLKPLPQETVISAQNLVVAPGFIDAHSHASGGIEEDPIAISQLTQGITTAVVGQDGYWEIPIQEFFRDLKATRPAINFAAFSGHGGIRSKVMGDDYKRAATPAEISQMTELIRNDINHGAIGLSTGLEYDPGYYSTTEEVIAVSQPLQPANALYISHMRDEGDFIIKAIEELLTIGKTNKVRAQVSHIKLGTAAVWNKSSSIVALLRANRTQADIYPYTYWQSTIAALSPSRNWDDRKIWVKGLADVGGPVNVRLTRFTPDPSWQGKTLDELSRTLKKDPITLIQEILNRTKDGQGSQSVVVTAMQESDLETFMKSPDIMFCSDGSIGGSHPRGAGSFPRILGRYVRDRKTLSLPEAIRKMTSLTAQAFQLRDRGQLKPNYIADITIFNPKTIKDNATPTDSTALSEGVIHVIVSGQITLKNGKPSGVRNGQIIRRNE